MNQTFETRDHALAAYLFTVAIEPTEITLRRPDVYFIYDSSTALMKAVAEYSGNPLVRSRNYFNALKKAKILISETIRGVTHEYSKATR